MERARADGEPEPELHVAFEGVAMAFGERLVFEALSCSFPRGRISVILGGSGVGKSTILRLVGGLVRPRAGRIRVCGRDITRLSEREMYAVRDQLGMMFQNGALLDSMSVFDNLAFPLREHTATGAAEVADTVHRTLASVGLSDVDELLPRQLSGGMIKRVGLARAIVKKPLVLLCDEPFSGLDPASARRIESLLCQINRDLGITMIVVSHDIASTLRMADHVVLLERDGALEGPPAELLASDDARVAEFFGPDFGPEFAPMLAAASRIPGGSR